MRWLLLCGVFVLAAALTPAAQQNPFVPPDAGTRQPSGAAPAPDGGTARIRGRVVRADTGAPLPGTQIVLGGPTVHTATTDDDGRYELAGLPAGRFVLSAFRDGMTLAYGQRRAFDQGGPITLADGQTLSRIDFAWPGGGVIVVRAVDEYGDPVAGLQVRVERYQYGPGGRQLATFPMGPSQNPFLTTNDLGEQRVFGLPPGEYVVSARIQPRQLTPGAAGAQDGGSAFLPTYYPGTADVAEAQTIAVGASQEVTAQFAMVPGRMARISGVVMNSRGRPAAGSSVGLATVTATTSGVTPGGVVAANGSFSVGNVPPGDYYLRVRPQGMGNPGDEVASLPISVRAADLTGLQLTTRPGTTIRGRVDWDGSAPRPAGDARVSTTSAAPRLGPVGSELTITYLDPENGTVREDGTFELGGIVGHVLFRVGPPTPRWMLREVTANGVDITDTGVDAATLGGDTRLRIVLTDRVTELSGSVRDTRGEPVTSYVLVLLPREPMDGMGAARFTRSVRPDQRGAFHVAALPPGRYVAAAFAALEQGREWDPALQQTVRDTGRAFTLAEGERLSLDLDTLTAVTR